jgi:ABC-type branched-subunit amino acid transport system substrate-binding protein
VPLWQKRVFKRKFTTILSTNVDAIAAPRCFQAATGIISFDENGDLVNKVAVILKIDNEPWYLSKRLNLGQ